MPATPRLAKMDEFGVEGCFLYCGNMVATISYLDEPKAAAAVMHAYNRWMLDDWGFNYKDRIYSAPLVSLDDLDAACAEAEWAIKNGTRLFLMPMGPFGGKPPAHPDFDRFWSILNEAHCRVVYHVSRGDLHEGPHGGVGRAGAAVAPAPDRLRLDARLQRAAGGRDAVVADLLELLRALSQPARAVGRERRRVGAHAC